MKKRENNDILKSICIVAPGGKNVIGDIATIYGDILVRDGFQYIFVDSKPNLKFKMFFDLIKKRYEYECIHVHTSGYLGDIPLIWTYVISKLLNKKIIITYHCGSPERILKKTHAIINIFFNSADLVTVPSDYSKQIILKYNKKLANKLIIFPNLLDQTKWTCNNIKKDTRRVLTVSSINKWYIFRKGLVLFVETAKYLPELEFYIVGKHDDSIEILKNIASENVHFTGYMSDADLIKFYHSSSVYCQFSIFESFGYALAEAMLCGCTPVVTCNASLPEVVGDAGYYVEELKPEKVAQVIKSAINKNKGDEAKNRIIQNFSVEKRQKDLVKIFYDVINK